MGVFKEAKNAYLERKAEIVAQRQGRIQEKEMMRGVEVMTITDESRSEYSERSHRSHRRKHRSEHRRGPELTIRPPTERYDSASTVRSATSSRRSASVSPRVPARSTSRSMPGSPDRPSMAMARRHTEQDLALTSPTHHAPQRSHSTSAIDMDLAYGDCHPKSLQTYSPQKNEAQEITGLVTKVKSLLEEADCARASVTAMITHLQSNPEAMAAVALTLAEISNLATKMAPGTLAALKGSAPAVFALLAAPEFLIAAGVGVGITVVAFGGYKIIKKLKAKSDIEKESQGMDEMVALSDVNLDRIEHWRRGIADSQLSSSGTSVEGEFITPLAVKMRSSTNLGRTPMAVPSRSSSKSKGDDGKSTKTSKSKKKFRSRSSKSEKDGSSVSGSSNGTGKDKQVVKVKKPSPLRMMFN